MAADVSSASMPEASGLRSPPSTREEADRIEISKQL
jgi:hypothetical protein